MEKSINWEFDSMHAGNVPVKRGGYKRIFTSDSGVYR